MGVEVLSRLQIMERVPADSPIEELMMSILEEGPGLGSRAGFAEAEDWFAALRSIREDQDVLRRNPIMVFPQARVQQYRTDALVVVEGMHSRSTWADPADHAFFIECDGLEHHGPDNLARDLEREREIRRMTGLPFLRFSGAEINFRPGVVEAVLGAKTELLAALHECGRDGLSSQVVSGMQILIQDVTWHPMLRRQYQEMNKPQPQVTYDPADPFGKEFREAADPEWERLQSLDECVSRLRHEVACWRQSIWPGLAREQADEYRPLRSIGEVIAEVLERVRR